MKLSQKHGLQPVIPLCPCCGKPKNQVALLGAAGDKLAKALGHEDGQMPMESVIPGDVELCEECSKLGIQIIECVEKGKKRKKRYPTGRFFIMKEEALDTFITDEKLRESVREHRKLLVDKEVADHLESCLKEHGENET